MLGSTRKCPKCGCTDLKKIDHYDEDGERGFEVKVVVNLVCSGCKQKLQATGSIYTQYNRLEDLKKI